MVAVLGERDRSAPLGVRKRGMDLVNIRGVRESPVTNYVRGWASILMVQMVSFDDWHRWGDVGGRFHGGYVEAPQYLDPHGIRGCLILEM